MSDSQFRPSILESGFNNNDNGAGFAYIENGKLKISKAYFKWSNFKRAFYSTVKRVKTGPMLVHFRWATHGSHNRTNTQPLWVQKDKLVMAHNGVFSSLSFDGIDLSDSVILSKIVKGLKWTLPFSRNQNLMLTGLCADRSKLVFLDQTGKYAIINEEAGAWRYGSWYSDGGDVFRRGVPAEFRKLMEGDAPVDDDDLEDMTAEDWAELEKAYQAPEGTWSKSLRLPPDVVSVRPDPMHQEMHQEPDESPWNPWSEKRTPFVRYERTEAGMRPVLGDGGHMLRKRPLIKVSGD